MDDHKRKMEKAKASKGFDEYLARKLMGEARGVERDKPKLEKMIKRIKRHINPEFVEGAR